MPARRQLELATLFVHAPYSATAGKPGRFRSIADCARRAGIEGAGDIATAWSTAEEAGLLVVHVDEPTVMLTSQGRAVQPMPVLQHQLSHVERRPYASGRPARERPDERRPDKRPTEQ